MYVVRQKSPDVLFCYHNDLGSYMARTEQEMINHLQQHRERGEKVPERAFERLIAERDGIPYKTDVDRMLESLNLDQIGFESPEKLLDDPPGDV